MTDDPTEERIAYVVVANDEEQYSIWPADSDLPAGWRVAGPEGTRQECLDHIEEHWTDLRPKSLRAVDG